MRINYIVFQDISECFIVANSITLKELYEKTNLDIF